MQSTCGSDPAGKVLISNIFHLFLRPMFARLGKLHGAHLHLVTVRVCCVRGRRICLIKSDSGYLATRLLCISNMLYSTSWWFSVICMKVISSCKLTLALLLSWLCQVKAQKQNNSCWFFTFSGMFRTQFSGQICISSSGRLPSYAEMPRLLIDSSWDHYLEQ